MSSSPTDGHLNLPLPSVRIPAVPESEETEPQEEETSSKATPTIRRYRKGTLLGKGAFGSVYLAMDLDNGKLFAIKQIDDFDDTPDGALEVRALENELKLLKNFQHENIVQYYGHKKSNTGISIFLEYVSGGSIVSLLEKFKTLDEQVARVYTRQILLGLEYLHSTGLAHRDIKGANVLVSSDGVVKLADFGASIRPGSRSARSSCSEMCRNMKGTSKWMAPEVIREERTEMVWMKADVWSVGCTVVEMVTGKPPWSQFSNPVTVMYHIASGKTSPEIPDCLSAEGHDFVELCFTRTATERPDIAALLSHAFVKCTKKTRTIKSSREVSLCQTPRKTHVLTTVPSTTSTKQQRKEPVPLKSVLPKLKSTKADEPSSIVISEHLRFEIAALPDYDSSDADSEQENSLVFPKGIVKNNRKKHAPILPMFTPSVPAGTDSRYEMPTAVKLQHSLQQSKHTKPSNPPRKTSSTSALRRPNSSQFRGTRSAKAAAEMPSLEAFFNSHNQRRLNKKIAHRTPTAKIEAHVVRTKRKPTVLNIN